MCSVIAVKNERRQTVSEKFVAPKGNFNKRQIGTVAAFEDVLCQRSQKSVLLQTFPSDTDEKKKSFFLLDKTRSRINFVMVTELSARCYRKFASYFFPFVSIGTLYWSRWHKKDIYIYKHIYTHIYTKVYMYKYIFIPVHMHPIHIHIRIYRNILGISNNIVRY